MFGGGTGYAAPGKLAAGAHDTVGPPAAEGVEWTEDIELEAKEEEAKDVELSSSSSESVS